MIVRGIGVAFVVLLASCIGAVAQQSAQPATKPANIDRNGVLILVRSSLLALDQANKTGNYTVLRDLGAPSFQVNTAAKLAEIFAPQRNEKLDLSGVVAIDPQLTILPEIENGMLHMAGFFPSVPSQVNFELLFAPVEGQWKLLAISIALGSATPAPPTPPPAPAAPPSKQPVAPPKAPAAKPLPHPSSAPTDVTPQSK
jgi:hypothetical protein